MLEMIFDPYNYPFWAIIIAILVGVIAIISRPFSTYVKFVYPNAKFEAMGNPFISEKSLSSLVESKNLNSFIESMNTLKDYEITGENIADVQQSLDQAFVQTILMMKKDSAKKMDAFFQAYLQKSDSYLLKQALRRKIEGKQLDASLAERAHNKYTKILLHKIEDAEVDQLPNLMNSQGFNSSVVEAFSADPADFIRIDTAIDRHMLYQFSEVKVPYKCTQATRRFVAIIKDIQNIKHLLRAKQLEYDVEICKQLFLGEGQEIASWKFDELAEVDAVSQVISGLEGTSYYPFVNDAIEQYTQDNSVQVFEQALDKSLLHHVRNLSTQHYVTIGPTLRFLVSKEFEIHNLKIIAKGIAEQLSPQMITTFLVMEDTS